MSKALRLSEKWFRRGLWLVAVVFASFLIGLGGTIVGDLPKVERPLQVDDFLDKAQARALRDTIRAQREAEQDAQTALEQAQLQHRKAISDNQAERETFNNWLATRRVTERADHDPEVLERTRKLDLLKQAERQALRAVEAQQQASLARRSLALVPQAWQKWAKALLRVVHWPHRSNRPMPQWGQKSMVSFFRSTGRSQPGHTFLARRARATS